MSNYLSIAQILVAVTLILIILLQVRGGGLGGIFGQADSVYRTRRGVERSLLQFTVIMAVIFVVLAIVTVRIS